MLLVRLIKCYFINDINISIIDEDNDNFALAIALLLRLNNTRNLKVKYS